MWCFIKYATFGEKIHLILHIYNSEYITIEYMYFINSPYWIVFLANLWHNDDCIAVENKQIPHLNPIVEEICYLKD